MRRSDIESTGSPQAGAYYNPHPLRIGSVADGLLSGFFRPVPDHFSHDTPSRGHETPT